MDGKLLLVVCVAILGGAYLLGSGTISLVSVGGSAGSAVVNVEVVDLRHNQIRQQLRREGYDLEDPASFVRERDGALVVGGPVAATEHLRPVFIDRVMSGYHSPVQSEEPGKVTEAEPVEACHFTPPETDSRIVNVFSNATLHPGSFYAFNAADLDPLAQQYLEAQANGAPPEVGLGNIATKIREAQMVKSGPKKAAPFRYSVMEVAVAETEVPVHLVLQTGQGRVLWNVHLADGAEISGVSLLGGYLPAVANLPRRVPVEVLDGAAMRECGVEPVRLPRATDPIFQDVDSGALPVARARDGLEELRTRSEAWNAWFGQQFGLRSDESRIGYDEGAILAVVGPLPDTPEDRVPYHSLRGARVTMAQADEAFAKDPGAAETRVIRMVKDRAESQVAANPAAAAN